LQTVEKNVETTVERKIVVVELSDSLVSSFTIAASLVVCEMNVDELPSSPISSPPTAYVCNKGVVYLCFENDNCVVSPKFEKHTTCIESRLLSKMGYTKKRFGRKGQGIVSTIVPAMLTPRTCLGYDVIVSSLPTPTLAVNKEVLFVVGGFQTDLLAEQSSEPIDEMVVPNMPYSKNIASDDVVVDISGCSTPQNTLDPEIISLDQPTHIFMPYHHPLHHRHGNHAFKYL